MLLYTFTDDLKTLAVPIETLYANKYIQALLLPYVYNCTLILNYLAVMVYGLQSRLHHTFRIGASKNLQNVVNGLLETRYFK